MREENGPSEDTTFLSVCARGCLKKAFLKPVGAKWQEAREQTRCCLPVLIVWAAENLVQQKGSMNHTTASTCLLTDA